MTTKWQDTRAGKRFLAAHGHKKRVKMTWLALMRIRSGWTVAEAAETSGIGPRTWEAWERVGSRRPTPGTLARHAIRFAFPTMPERLLTHTPYVTVNPQTLEILG